MYKLDISGALPPHQPHTIIPCRYFYDHGDPNPGKLSPHQLVEVRRASLARVHCDNGDNIQLLAPLSFRRQSALNPLVPCSSLAIPRINLLPWKEGLQLFSPANTSTDLTGSRTVGAAFFDVADIDRQPKQSSSDTEEPSFSDFNIDVNFG